MPVLNVRWKASFAFALVAFVTVVAVVGWANFTDGIATRSRGNAYGVDLDSTDDNNLFTNWTSADTALALLVQIDSFDPSRANNALGFHIDYNPINNLIANLTEVAPKDPLRLVLAETTVNFAANTTMPTQVQSFLLTGDVNSYPFDSYTADYQISAYSSPSNSSFGDPLPITAFVFGTAQGFKINTQFQGLRDDGSQLQLTFTVNRNAVTKVFAVLIFIVMWCLSGGIFVVAMSIWFRGKKAEPPLIAISTALLFALPNVRNSQPGIAAVAGTTSDMAGFFWNMLLVAISAFSLIINYILSNRRGPPATPAPTPVQAPSAIDLEHGTTTGQFFEKRL